MSRTSRSRTLPGGLILAVSALAVLTVGGTIGYRLIEGFSLLDSLFMTVITLSTVGYGEVQPLSPLGRAYSIGLIMVGLGIALYTVGAIAEFLLEDRISGLFALRKMNKRIEDLSNHVILVGYGRFGRVVGKQLLDNEVPFVVIDVDEDVQPSLEAVDVPYLIASALDEETLSAAGIERARAIVIGTARDADNVFIALCARDLNPQINIHARAETETGERRLRNAGAEQVVSPLQVGGHRIANALVRPAVLDFIELTDPGRGSEIDLEEVLVTADGDLEGCSIGDLAEPGALLVVGLRQNDGMQLQPAAGQVLTVGDSLVVVGRRDRLRELSMRARSHSA